MRSVGSVLVLALVAAATAVIACGSKDQMQDPSTGAAPVREVAASDDPSLPPGYASPLPSSPLPGASGGDGGLAIPGPTALACTSDADCITHRCNLAYGRCAFPCASDVDCTNGTYCYRSVVSACMPH